MCVQAAAPGGAPGNEIMYLAWNHKVQHILATCSVNGTSSVWDLKRGRPVISFKDSNRYNTSSVLCITP
jgi:protein transport protein SEC31